MKITSRVLAAFLALSFSLYATAASAAIYTIDPTLSSITLTGTISGSIPIVAQKPGSNVLALQGTIDATKTGSMIQFNSAAVDGIEKPGPYNPGIVTDGDPPVIGPNGPGDVALYIGASSIGKLVLRDLLISITGNSVLTGSDFNLADLTLFMSGTGDYNITLASLGAGHLALDNEDSPFPEGLGSLVNGVMTLPISIDIVQNIETGPDSSIPLVVSLRGQIVASVPEPGTIAMMGAGLIGLIAVGRRRFRKA